ncbi:CHAT domain-containing protein [Suillus lakei]|nr:CHAT domain-containing protein [Suillus lakei]
MPSSLEGRYIKLEVIGGTNLKVPSCRIPAGIYISINLDSSRRWKSVIRVPSSKRSVAWGDSVTLSLDASPGLSVEIRASFELDRMLGGGEVIGKLDKSWDDLLNHGDEPFDISFPPVRGVDPTLTLKATLVHAFNNQDSERIDSIVECQVARDTDAGHTQIAEYMTSNTVSHLNDAVQHFTLILDQCPVGHPDHAAALTNLAWARLQGHIRKYFPDVDFITSLFREALALRPQGHPDHPLTIYNLIKVLIWRYNKERAVVYIHESAQLSCELLPLCPEGTYLRSIATGAHDVDYVIHACNKLPIDASDEGIRLRRFVLELCPLGHMRRHRALHELAQAVERRFHQCGSIDDIDECIQCRREAVSLCPKGHSIHDSYLNNLALSLKFRFDHQGKYNDLNEAISIYEDALHPRPVGYKYRDFSLNNLGAALLDRFNQRGDVDDLQRAISLRREALTLRPPGNPYRDSTLNNLALALQTRYDKLHISEDLNEAIDLYRELLQLEQHARRSVLVSRKLGRMKMSRRPFDFAKNPSAALPSLHPDRYFSYMGLQEAYLSRYRVQRKSADLSLAVDNFRLASQHPTQGFPERINEAINWTFEAERHNHPSALEAYKTFFELLDRHLTTRSSIVARREATSAFSRARTLPVNAASCAVRLEILRDAIELLEQGRGQQWSLASRLRSPLEDLQSTNPNLAHTFSDLSKRLSETQGSAVSTDRAAADLAEPQYRRLMEQWEAAVAQIRNLQARHGPVIILIASEYSCSAIVVQTSGEPHHVPLPSITLTDLKNLKDHFARAIRHTSIMGPKEPRNDIIVLLRTVWDEIMLPIVNVLQHDLKLKYHSRIWLCPTAAFTSIPLHAAHPFRTKADRSKELCLEDLYICSYTPTLSALVRSRRTMKTVNRVQEKARRSWTVDSELELVRKLVPATGQPHHLCLATQPHEQVHSKFCNKTLGCTLPVMASRTLLQPYNSHFVMKDEPLTLLDIMEKDIPHAELAFLSACHTAAGDEETPDEVIHLAAGLQFSGFKSVVGTLWEVDDAVAKHVVEAFYKNIFKDLEDGGVIDCTKAAWALNRATHAVKTKVPLEQRMVFIHIGV